MFARRKRKPREDEPLVPHGMIWQATEDPMSSSNSESAQPEQVSSPSPIQMPKFWRKPAPDDPTVRRAPVSVAVNAPPNPVQKPIERPQPVSAAPIQELNKRRMLIEAERAQREPQPREPNYEANKVAPVPTWRADQHVNPVEAAPRPVLISSSISVSPSASPEPRSIEPTPTIDEPEHAEVPQKSLWVRQAYDKAKEGLLRTHNGLTALQRRAHLLTWRADERVNPVEADPRPALISSSISVSPSAAPEPRSIEPTPTIDEPEHAEVPQKSLWVRQAYDKAKEGLLRTHNGLTALQRRAHLRQRAEVISLYGQRGAAVLRQRTHEVLAHVQRSGVALGQRAQHTGSLSRQIWSRKIKVRIAARGSFRAVLSPLLQAKVAALGFLRGNRRLVTSMTMAAISALLALGMILALKTHEPVSRANIEKTIPAPTVSAASLGAKPSATTGASPVGSAASVTKSAPVSATAPIVQSVIRKPIRRRARHVQDDYVARDTYVYYGSR